MAGTIELKAFAPYCLFAILCLLSTAAFSQSFVTTISLALHDDQYTHILLILPVVAALVISDLRAVNVELAPKLWPGASLLLIGVSIALLSRLWPARSMSDWRLAANMLALVILWIASFVLCFEVKAGRSLLFPLCFLSWMVPIPSWALARIVQWLQQGSAIITTLLFSGAGVPSSRDGMLVTIPGLTIEVAKECSSIRSSLMLVITTMVLAHVLLDSFWRKALAVAIAVPLSVAKNGLRIFTIAMLGTRVDPGDVTGGVIFFAISLLVVGALLWILRRTQVDTPSPDGRGPQFQTHHLLEN
jgi:exosortase